jgi:predicted transcriptional regulator
MGYILDIVSGKKPARTPYEKACKALGRKQSDSIENNIGMLSFWPSSLDIGKQIDKLVSEGKAESTEAKKLVAQFKENIERYVPDNMKKLAHTYLDEKVKPDAN